MSKGDYAVGAVIDFMFTTYGYNGPTTFVGGAVAVYVGNSLTEITAGITLTVDFDGRTGLHQVRVDTAGYTPVEDYHLVITAGTVDGETRAGTLLDSFSINKTSALRPATAGRTLDVDSSGDVDISQTAADKVWASAARTLTSFGTLVSDTAAAAATAVWAAGSRTLTSFGTLVADVWASASRTLTAFGFTGAIVDAVWDEVASDHATAGTTGAALTAAGSATDPLNNAVPGSYASGTAGFKIGQLGITTVTFSAPVLASGNAQLVRGADYYEVDGNALNWHQDALNTAWPDLTGAAVQLVARTPGGAAYAFTIDGTVVTPSGANKHVRIEIPRATTAALAKGAYPFALMATLSNGHVVPLFQGHILFVDALAS